MKAFLGILGVLVMIYLIFWFLPFGVIKYQTTSDGEHTGVVTAIEKTGIFFKTWTAYVKTSPTSTQEDTYCVIDPTVISELQSDADNQTVVDLHYVSWLKTGIQNCNGEPAIITSVSTVAN